MGLSSTCHTVNLSQSTSVSEFNIYKTIYRPKFVMANDV